jgi:CheY-like chemotaxis protein
MTLTALPPAGPQTNVSSAWAPRSAAVLLADQLAALDAWNAARRDAESALAAVGTNREDVLDARRRAVAVRRETEALLARSAELLEASGDPLLILARPRALVVHRQEWLCTKVAAALEAGGAQVLGVLGDGAEAVGWSVADQPDLLLLEEMLPTLPGREVVRKVREFSPSTVVAVQVGYEDAVQPMLDAGAHLAVPRRVPPADLARAMLDRVVV